MSEEMKTDAAILASLSLEETRGTVTLRAAQELSEGILPGESHQEDRKVKIESCCLVSGPIFGKSVELADCDKRTLTTRSGKYLPGTPVAGGNNAFEDVAIGVGCVVGASGSGGILAGGDVEIRSAIPVVEGGPSRTIVIGSVSGENITIGDGAVVLGAVIGQTSVTIGNGVTIRDHVVTPSLKAGDGNLFGGMLVGGDLALGDLNTIASGRILIPADSERCTVKGRIRSPYPGCNNCPHSNQLGGGDDIEDYGRRLSCHLFSSLEIKDRAISVSPGSCTSWSEFDLESPNTFEILDHDVEHSPWRLRCVTNWPVDALNLDYDSDHLALWETTAESLGGI